MLSSSRVWPCLGDSKGCPGCNPATLCLSSMGSLFPLLLTRPAVVSAVSHCPLTLHPPKATTQPASRPSVQFFQSGASLIQKQTAGPLEGCISVWVSYVGDEDTGLICHQVPISILENLCLGPAKSRQFFRVQDKIYSCLTIKCMWGLWWGNQWGRRPKTD